MSQHAYIYLPDGRKLNYEIRPSSNSRSLRLEITAREGLTVIAPKGLDERQVVKLVSGKRDWVAAKLDQLEEVRRHLLDNKASTHPEAFNLPALAEAWRVEYRTTKGKTVGARTNQQGQILVYGAVIDDDRCKAALHRWLARRAKETLTPWLESLATKNRLSFKRVVIKNQCTHWGSCSADNVISLNSKLLFLPSKLVGYVLIHELCHTLECNYTNRFWIHLQQYEPETNLLHREMQDAWKSIPVWARPVQAGKKGRLMIPHYATSTKQREHKKLAKKLTTEIEIDHQMRQMRYQMKHVPTYLYIDTCCVINEWNKGLNTLKEKAPEGTLRLLVPEIMKRELSRRFEKEAANNTPRKANKAHTINKSPPVKSSSQKYIEKKNRKWFSFKKHFKVEELGIVGSLEDVIDWYFKVQSPFKESDGKRKEFPDAFIISVLDQYHSQHRHEKIAVISCDNDFKEACESRSSYTYYFSSLDEYIKAFEAELLGKIFIITEELVALKTILDHDEHVTKGEIQQVMKLLKSKRSNYDYFFHNADNFVWFKHLSEGGYFLKPPNVEKTTEGHYFFPSWPPLEYLIRIFDAAPAEVLHEISKLPNTDNPRVLQGILKIVLKADSAEVVSRFYQPIISLIENRRWGSLQSYEGIISLLKKPFIFDSQLAEVMPTLLRKLVEFHKNPYEQGDWDPSKGTPEDSNILLEPLPHFEQWEYRQILEKSVRPLAEREPYQVVGILIDAVANMIPLMLHPEKFDNARTEDYSEIWCRKLDKSDRVHQNIKETLVQTLTYTCEQVYNKAPESIYALDQELRNQHWKIFRRLRQYLYASYPNKQTLPWIHELILGHNDYSRQEHSYEFQLMIRKASENFGRRLLNEDEQATIFNAILSGPSEEDFRKSIDENYSEEVFQKRQHYFHRMQLRPFSVLLSGEVQRYFNELEGETQAEAITDDSYLPYGRVTVSTVSSHSLESVKDLENFTDEELLNYLNKPEKEYHD